MHLGAQQHQQKPAGRRRLGPARSDRLPEWLHTLALVAAVLAAAIVYPLSARADAAVERGALAPDFALQDTTGHNQRLSEFRGDVVVLTFWAGWCGECRTLLEQIDTELPAGSGEASSPVLLGVSLEAKPERARAVADSLQLDFPTLVDTRQQVARLYDVSRLPLTLVLDREGVVREVYERGVLDAAQLARIQELSRQ
jgi:peroxiredoxin